MVARRTVSFNDCGRFRQMQDDDDNDDEPQRRASSGSSSTTSKAFSFVTDVKKWFQVRKMSKKAKDDLKKAKKAMNAAEDVIVQMEGALEEEEQELNFRHVCIITEVSGSTGFGNTAFLETTDIFPIPELKFSI